MPKDDDKNKFDSSELKVLIDDLRKQRSSLEKKEKVIEKRGEELKDKLKHRIITVTLCPNFDRTLWLKNFKAGGTFLADDSKTIAAGKGVNVSRALRNHVSVAVSIRFSQPW